MLTNNYSMDLMTPSQPNKDVVFNEAITKLDSFCGIVVSSFEGSVPASITIGAVHIISSGSDKYKICYCPSAASGWRIQEPKEGMIFFVKSENGFFCFNGASWEKVDLGSAATSSSVTSSGAGSEMVKPQTTGVSGYISIPAGVSKMWLYMSANGKIDINSATTNTITFIIKQHYQTAQNLEFVGNILWKGKTPFKVSAKPNSMDIIRFHKISETDHWIPEIVGQGFEY
ncbi:MAG: hypothetical protein RLZZ59_728 [Pseudomonadota bacterium]|jgi:hypothetical protein